MFITNITKRKSFHSFFLNIIVALIIMGFLYLLKLDIKLRYYLFVALYAIISTIIYYFINKHKNIKQERELFFYGEVKVPNQNFLKFFPKNEFKGSCILISVNISNHKEIINAFNEEFYHKILNKVFDNIKEEIKNKNLIVSNTLRKITIVGKNINEENIIKGIQDIFYRKMCIDKIPVSLEAYIGYEIVNSIKNLHSPTLFDKANIASNYALSHNIEIVNFENIKETFSFDYTLLKYIPIAMENKEIVFLFQPIVSKKKEKNLCVEMLVRWNRKGKTIMPNDFIPALEKTELIHDLSLYAINEATKVIKMFQDKGMEIAITINVSPKNINNNKFIDDALALVKSSGLNPSLYEFEITEGTLMDFTNRNVINLNKIRAAGIVVTIDDFGVGYSSVTYLNNMIVDYIKIDKSLLRNVLTNKKEEKVFKNVVNLIKDLEYGLVVEGVETKEQLDFLNTLNVDFYQGYFISKPIDLEELEEFVDKNYSKYVL